MKGGENLHDWEDIKVQYITTNCSYRQLAAEYSVHYQTICAHAKKEDWSALREQYRNRTLARTVERISDQHADKAAAIVAVADDLIARAAVLAATDDLTVTQLRQLMGVLRDARNVYSIRTEDERREQEARIAHLEQKAGLLEKGDFTVEVNLVDDELEPCEIILSE